jgi:YegS/Rv2252/BmrU family lipid kinase
MKRIVFIINPIAGTRKKVNVAALIHKYINTNLFTYEIKFTEYKGHAQELAQQAVLQKADIVAASGGDGTINEIARALINTDVALAILPMGSGNGLARHLGIPLHIPSAIISINNLHIKKIDTGIFNQSIFLSNAGTGFIAAVAESFDHKKTFRGFWGYTWHTLKNLFRYVPVSCIIETDDKQIEGYFFAINVCNSNQFGYQAKVAPDARLDDGLFEIVMVRKSSIFSYAWMMILLFTGNVYYHPSIIHLQSKSIRISTKSYTHFQVDGEPLGKNKFFEAHINPLSLNMIVP